MQVWVRDVLEAQQLLDYQTGERYSKAEVCMTLILTL